MTAVKPSGQEAPSGTEAQLAGEARGKRGPLTAFAVLPVLGVAVAFFAVEMAVAARYGYHRDELYFIACARHMAWGYVDQPPFVPAVAWLAGKIFGSSVVGVRAFPALAGCAAVVLTGLMARELGGGRRAQWLSAVFAAASSEVLATAHLLSTATFDLVFWAATSWLVLRLLRTGDQRIWALIGLVTGVGLLNKYNVLFIAGAVVAGLLAGKNRRLLAGWWPWAGAAVAVAIWSPNIDWNATHHWASFQMLQSLHHENSNLGSSLGFIPAQLVIVGPVLAPLWLAGLRRLFRHQFARPIAAAYAALVVVDVIVGAKSYYLGGIYFVLLAGGGLWADGVLEAARRLSTKKLVAGVLAGSAAALPLALPVLPVSWQPRGAWIGNINKDLSATVGWHRVVSQLAAVASKLPRDQRGRLVIFTGDYGAAGAVDMYGSPYGMPRAFSGHNSYWWWGPPPPSSDGATTIAVNLDRSYLLTIFDDVTPAGVVDTGHHIWSEELGAPIYVCTHQKIPWAQAWPAVRHYG